MPGELRSSELLGLRASVSRQACALSLGLVSATRRRPRISPFRADMAEPKFEPYAPLCVLTKDETRAQHRLLAEFPHRR